MKLIETKTLASAAASIEFTSIPQDGTDLLFTTSLRATVDDSVVLLSFNGSTSSFSQRYLLGNGSTASSGTYARYGATMVNSVMSANTFANTSLYIPNYAGSTNKSYSSDDVSETNGTLAYQLLGAGLWSNTAAITSVTFSANTGNLAIGSTISLYKITKGSSGGVVVS